MNGPLELARENTNLRLYNAFGQQENFKVITP